MPTWWESREFSGEDWGNLFVMLAALAIQWTSSAIEFLFGYFFWFVTKHAGTFSLLSKVKQMISQTVFVNGS